MTRKPDRYDLQRFVRAQNSDGMYERALCELIFGKKRTHWIWFVFPRLIGLDYSSTSTYYALPNRWAARAYMRHPILGPRLIECVRTVLKHRRRWLIDIFGLVDAAKVRQCAKLFASLAGADPVFKRLLDKM